MDKENILSQEKFYICLHEGCDRKFRTLAGRSKHHRKCDKTLKEKEKGYNNVDAKEVKCKDCDKFFSEVANSHKHHRNVHLKIMKKIKKTFTCLVCSKIFQKQSKLFRHQLTHKRNLNICMGCGQTFKHPDHYDSHVAKCSFVVAQSENECEHYMQTFVEGQGINPLEMCFEDGDINENPGYSALVAEEDKINEINAVDDESSMEKYLDFRSFTTDGTVIEKKRVPSEHYIKEKRESFYCSSENTENNKIRAC